MVTTAGKSSTTISQNASGTPSSSSMWTFRHLLDAESEDLREAADRVEVDRARRLEAVERLLAHAALADDAADRVLADHVRLVGLLADRRRRAGGDELPLAVGLLPDDGTAVIDHAVPQDRPQPLGLLLDHDLVRRIARRHERPREEHLVAEMQLADGVGADRKSDFLGHVALTCHGSLVTGHWSFDRVSEHNAK
jgi:hypothetical protein